MTHPSRVALQGMAHSFIELDKAVAHMKDWLVFWDDAFQSVCPLMEKNKRLMKASWWGRLTEGEIGSCSDGWGHAQFSWVAQSCLDSLQPYEPQHTRPPCPSLTPGVYPTHVHWVGDAIWPSHPLSSSSPAFNLSQYFPGSFQMSQLFPKIKSDTVSPSICHEVMGPDAMIFK